MAEPSLPSRLEELQRLRRRFFKRRPAADTTPVDGHQGLARRLLGDRRLLLVSNREPYVRHRTAEGVRYERTTGGLVTALDPVMRSSGGVWVAWQPETELSRGADGDPRAPRYQVPAEGPQFTLRQVPLTHKEVARYYFGFANRALWPLCHYFVDRCVFDEQDWRQYVEINERFADVVAEEARPGDVVWVHDYHFCVLPQKIRERRGDAGPLAFFLHIPFPAGELFRILPWRREVLAGLLGADLVGFHTEQYAGDFLGCCSRLLGARVDHARQVVEWQGREVRVGAFPIGIEVDEFSAQATSATTREKVARIRQGLGAAQLVLGVDRLDYSKGILERLRAVDALLERHPELRRKIVFLQIAVPSRTQVQEYRDLKREIDEMVGRVNGRHGAADWTPVRYLYRSIPRPDLVSYYRAADVCLVNPLRDGMNLVAMEYVACQAGKVADRLKDGVLVLSELTGAASVLGDGPLLINPFAIQETAEALERALAMDEGERRTRMEKLLASVRAHDVHGWLERILSAAMQSEKRRGAGARRHDPLH